MGFKTKRFTGSSTSKIIKKIGKPKSRKTILGKKIMIKDGSKKLIAGKMNYK